MASHFAVKRLSASDLTFFEPLFRSAAGGGTNQKCINLNARPFSTKFFPALNKPVQAQKEANQRFSVDLTVAGPDGWPAIPYVDRVITKSAKNWRLETMIEEPEGQHGRFGSIATGDMVVFRFGGDDVPTTVDIVILSKMADAAIAGQVADLFSIPTRDSMLAVTPSDLQTWADAAHLSVDHPLRALAVDNTIVAAMVEATYGNEAAARTLKKKAGRAISHAEMALARARAEASGRKGEIIAWEYLNSLKAAGLLQDARWISEVDAAASWDFDVVTLDGTSIRMDAKSTVGHHETPFHMSGAQIAAAAESVRYDLIRVSFSDSRMPKIRIAKNIATLAKSILAQCANLPEGILPDGFSIATSALDWEPEVTVTPPVTVQAAATDGQPEASAIPATVPKA